MTSLHVDLPSYRVTIEPGALATLGTRVQKAAPAYRYAVITDDAVGALLADRVVASFRGERVVVLTVSAGEAHKTREWWARLTDAMLDAGCGRDTTVVALGGGVVGDLAGFVAGTFMRGVPVVQAPTTLLAMIDASVGGKTGVDTPAGKNLVGVFHQPSAVVIDPETLATLPREHLRAGLAEAIKHGVIADEAYFERTAARLHVLLADEGWRAPEMTDLIATSVAIKTDVVRADERERGRRKVLNFGHTLGHSIELLSDYTVLHGEAVAAGMALESAVAERAGISEAGTADRVREVLASAGLPVGLPARVPLDADALVRATHLDKKARAGEAEYALPRRIGAMAGAESGWAVRVPDGLVRAVIERERPAEEGRP